MPAKPPIVHIHPPRYPHDAIEVIGNRAGIVRLINALVDSVISGEGLGEVCTGDGEASEVRVTRLVGRRRPEEWRRSGSPYWDIDDPLIARILDLSEEVGRLRQAVATMRRERAPIVVEYRGGAGAADARPSPAD